MPTDGLNSAGVAAIFTGLGAIVVKFADRFLPKSVAHKSLNDLVMSERERLSTEEAELRASLRAQLAVVERENDALREEVVRLRILQAQHFKRTDQHFEMLEEQSNTIADTLSEIIDPTDPPVTS